MPPKGSLTSKKAKPEKPTCLKCKKEKAVTGFYVNTHPLFSSEKLEVCKECINEFIGEKGSRGYQDRVVLVLGLMNKPFLADLWLSRDEDWSKFIPQLSSFPQYKGLTFSNSNFSLSNKQSISESPKSPNESHVSYEEETLTPVELTELTRFWGRGKDFKEEDYIYLQNEYERLINSYECETYAMELLFQDVAQQRLTIKKMREEGKSVDKELKTLQDLLGSANIKPVQETGANAAEQATFGTLIKKYENERPIPEPDDSWKDVDGIKKYIQVWFLGHLCKMLGISNEYSKMYEEEIQKHTVEAPEYEDDEA